MTAFSWKIHNAAVETGKNGYNRFLLLVAGLGGLLYGVDVGIISGVLPYLEATSGLNAGQLSFIVAAVLRNTLSEFGSVARGVCQLADDRLESVREIVGIEKYGRAARYSNGTGEFHTLTGEEIVSMNMWGFNPTLFEHLRQQLMEFLKAHGSDEKAEFYIPSVVNTLIRSGEKQVKVLLTHSSWFGITYREDRPFVAEGIRRLIRNGEYPERLWT